MKKFILSFLFAGVIFSNGYCFRDLYGIYVRLDDKSFYCAMISTNLCARVSCPDDAEPNPWRASWKCYNPDGSVAETFTCSEYTITEDGNNTIVEYIP